MQFLGQHIPQDNQQYNGARSSAWAYHWAEPSLSKYGTSVFAWIRCFFKDRYSPWELDEFRPDKTLQVPLENFSNVPINLIFICKNLQIRTIFSRNYYP